MHDHNHLMNMFVWMYSFYKTFFFPDPKIKFSSKLWSQNFWVNDERNSDMKNWLQVFRMQFVEYVRTVKLRSTTDQVRIRIWDLKSET